MSSRVAVWAAFGSVLLLHHALSGSAQDQKLAALKAEVKSMDDKMAAAFEKKDADGMVQFHAADYSSTSVEGKESNLATVKQGIPMLFSLMKSGKAKSTIDKLEIIGEQVVVTGPNTVEMVLGVPGAPDQTMVVTSVNRSTLQRTKDGLRILRTEELQRKVTVNGTVLEDRKREEKSEKSASPK